MKRRLPSKRPDNRGSRSVLDKLAGKAMPSPRTGYDDINANRERGRVQRSAIDGDPVDEEIEAEVSRLRGRPDAFARGAALAAPGPQAELVAVLREQLHRANERIARLEMQVQQGLDRIMALTAPHSLSALSQRTFAGPASVTGGLAGTVREGALERGALAERTRMSAGGGHVRTPAPRPSDPQGGLRRPAHPDMVEQANDQAEVVAPVDIPPVVAEPLPFDETIAEDIAEDRPR